MPARKAATDVFVAWALTAPLDQLEQALQTVRVILAARRVPALGPVPARRGRPRKVAPPKVEA